jgi:hypothetical protein
MTFALLAVEQRQLAARGDSVPWDRQDRSRVLHSGMAMGPRGGGVWALWRQDHVCVRHEDPVHIRHDFFGTGIGSALNPDFCVMTFAIASGVVFAGSKVTSAFPFA